MADLEEDDLITEYYEVVKTVEIWVKRREEPERMRIEALRRGSIYPASAYILKTTTAVTRNSEAVKLWISYDLPWTRRDTAVGAIQQAVGFLHERRSY